MASAPDPIPDEVLRAVRGAICSHDDCRAHESAVVRIARAFAPLLERAVAEARRPLVELLRRCAKWFLYFNITGELIDEIDALLREGEGGGDAAREPKP